MVVSPQTIANVKQRFLRRERVSNHNQQSLQPPLPVEPPHYLSVVVFAGIKSLILPALVDTGASHSSVPKRLVERLGVPIRRSPHYVFDCFDGKLSDPLPTVTILTAVISSTDRPVNPFLHTFVQTHNDAIIGRDLIAKLNLRITSKGVFQNGSKLYNPADHSLKVPK